MSKSETDKDWSDLIVQFVPGHPHEGEYGVPTGKSTTVGTSKMFEFTILNCEHGTDGCFAKPGMARLVPDAQCPNHIKAKAEALKARASK